LLEILRKLLQQADPSRTAGEIKRKASLAAQKISPSRERLQIATRGRRAKATKTHRITNFWENLFGRESCIMMTGSLPGVLIAQAAQLIMIL
jgi:hypothetical protein